MIFETPLPAPSLPPALPRSCLCPSTRCAPPVPRCAGCPRCSRHGAVTAVPRASPSWALSWPVPAASPQPCPGCRCAPAPTPGTDQGSSCCWAHTGDNLPPGAGCSPPWGTSWGPTINPLCPQGSWGCPPYPTSWSPSCAQGKEGHPQPLAMAPRRFSAGSSPCLPAGHRCAAPCGLPRSPSAGTDPAAILFQSPQRAPEPYCTLHTFLGSTTTWYCHWFWSIAEPRLAWPVGTGQWESRHPWAALVGVRVRGEAGGHGRSWGALGSVSGDIQEDALQGQRDSFPSPLAV